MRHWAEEVARDHLLTRGWTLLEENAVVRRGEIDLVMRDGPTLVAVEVRQRANDRYGDVAETLRADKLARVRASLRAWVLRRYGREDLPMRLDAVLVRGGPGRARIEHLRGIGR